jgi:hypothetical protein
MVNHDDIVPLKYHGKVHNLEIELCSDTVERLNRVTAEPFPQEAWYMILTQRRKVDLIRTGRCWSIVKIAFLTKAIQYWMRVASTYPTNHLQHNNNNNNNNNNKNTHNDLTSFPFFSSGFPTICGADTLHVVGS